MQTKISDASKEKGAITNKQMRNTQFQLFLYVAMLTLQCKNRLEMHTLCADAVGCEGTAT